MKRTYHLIVFGCQMNLHDAERIAGSLEAAGWAKAAGEDEADCIILLTCCVRESAESRLYGRLASMKSLKDGRPLKIAVGGCIAQKEGESLLDAVPHVDLVFGTAQYPNIVPLLEKAEHSRLCAVEMCPLRLDALPVFRSKPFRAWVTITRGCDNHCSYCIVPRVRGPEASREIEDVLEEVEEHVRGGAREINLLGQNVNSFRLKEDGTSRFSRLLGLMAERFPDTWIRFTTSHPRDFNSEIIDAMARHPNICEHLHLPLQAGSDRILEAMNRGYTAAQYLDKIFALRRAVPGVSISTDLIVGFPGESAGDFEKTLEVVEAAGFDASFTFIYNSRPGTAAGRMPDDVSAIVKQERLQRLMNLTRELSAQSLAKEVGRETEVLVSGVSRKDPGNWTSRTGSNKIVHFERRGEDLAGKRVKVAITQAGSWSLKARALQVIG